MFSFNIQNGRDTCCGEAQCTVMFSIKTKVPKIVIFLREKGHYL